MKTVSKLGKLIIHREKYDLELIEALPKLLILDICFVFYKDSFELVCSHDSFDEVALGVEVPIYKILFANDVFYGFQKE